MARTYYEVVLEGHLDTIFGLLEGVKIGAGKKWDYYFSKKVDVKRETFSEAVKEWISLGAKLHHVLIEEDFLNFLKSAMSGQPENASIGMKFLKSQRKIRSGSFKFEFKAYSSKIAAEVKQLIESLPAELALEGYNPKEKVDKEAKGVELYTPDHEYVFEGEATLKGPLPELIRARSALNSKSYVEVDQIALEWAE